MVKELPEEIQDSLTRAGVHSGYHRRSMTEKPEWIEFVDWLKYKGEDLVRKGRGITVCGLGLEGTDSVFMIARTLHIIGQSVRVLGLSDLVTALGKFASYNEVENDFFDVGTLCVHKFEEVGELPLTRWQRLQVEDLLIGRRARGKGSLLHTANLSPRHEGKSLWWPKTIEEIMFTENLIYPLKATEE